MFDRFYRSVMGNTGPVGVGSYENQILESLARVGAVKMSAVTVLGLVSITGSVKAEACKLNTVTVTGTVTINDSQVEGTMTITGSVDATKTKFRGDIQLTTNRSNLVDSSAENIIIDETRESKSGAPRELHLIGDTVVRGNIRFEGGNGSIFKSQNAVIQGEVFGAVVHNSLGNHL